MSLSTWFGWSVSTTTSDELPNIFPLAMKLEDFVKTDIITIYSKILTDVVERTNGLGDDQQFLLWDNCVKSESSDGLISHLAKAMYERGDLFLVYEKAVKVIRIATFDERKVIEADYKATGKSNTGVFISFKNYARSDMVKLYSAFEHCTVGSLNKTMNLSKAVQIKVSNLRGAVGLLDAEAAKTQAVALALALSKGQDVYLDAADSIETAKPDLTPIVESVKFLDQKRSLYLGMPTSYLNGEQTGGMGSTGENDTKAIERGLKNYYFSVMKPVIEAIFGVKLNYKSQDFRQISQGLEAMKVFALVEDEAMLSGEDKKKIINQLFDIDTAAGSNA